MTTGALPPLRTSERGIDLIKRFEGLRLKAYRCPAGIPTIGYGHTGPEVKADLAITCAEADALLRADLQRFETQVRRHAGVCGQHQFDALVSFAFNVGFEAMARSTLLRKHRAGDHTGAADEFLRWNRAGGRVLAGLARRREAERKLYLSNDAQRSERP